MIANRNHQLDPGGFRPRQGLVSIGVELRHLDMSVGVNKH
jgi:hypothetical protein